MKSQIITLLTTLALTGSVYAIGSDFGISCKTVGKDQLGRIIPVNYSIIPKTELSTDSFGKNYNKTTFTLFGQAKNGHYINPICTLEVVSAGHGEMTLSGLNGRVLVSAAVNSTEGILKAELKIDGLVTAECPDESLEN